MTCSNWHPLFCFVRPTLPRHERPPRRAAFQARWFRNSCLTIRFPSTSEMTEFEVAAGRSSEHVGVATLDSVWALPQAPGVTPREATRFTRAPNQKLRLDYYPDKKRLEVICAGKSKHRRLKRLRSICQGVRDFGCHHPPFFAKALDDFWDPTSTTSRGSRKQQ